MTRRTLSRALITAVLGVALLSTNAGASAPNAGRGTDPYLTTGALGYDVLHYDLSLTYVPKTHGIGISRVEIVAAATTTLKSFTLDASQRLGIIDVTVNGHAAHFSHAHDKMGITPSAALPSRKQFRVVIRYHGTPSSHPDTSMRGPVGWEPTKGGSVAYTEPDGLHEFMPSKDVLYDKATWLVHLTAPGKMMGVATGRLVSTTHSSAGTTTVFSQDQPITDYQQMIAFDTFLTSSQSISGIRSFIAVPKGGPSLTLIRDRTRTALTWLTARLGPFPYKDTGAIVVSGGESAMETAGRPTYSDDDPYDYEPATIVHELSHEWFAGRVTATNASDLWMHEAFATWFERYWISQQPGGEPFESHLRRDYLIDGFQASTGGQFGKVSVEAPTNAYRLESTVYYRGAEAVEALRHQLGATAFGKLVRGLAQQPAGHTFTTSQLVALAERISGTDLTSWRTTWLQSKTAQLPTTPATNQQIANELGADIGLHAYFSDGGDTLTEADLKKDAEQAIQDGVNYLPDEIMQLGATSSGMSGSTAVTRITVSAPAGLYPTTETACLTFPSEGGNPGAWYGENVHVSTDFSPDTVTLQACP